jgi:hypothetical protein
MYHLGSAALVNAHTSGTGRVPCSAHASRLVGVCRELLAARTLAGTAAIVRVNGAAACVGEGSGVTRVAGGGNVRGGGRRWSRRVAWSTRIGVAVVYWWSGVGGPGRHDRVHVLIRGRQLFWPGIEAPEQA